MSRERGRSAATRGSRGARRLASALGGIALLAAAPAGAATIPLDLELDTGASGSFGTVEVSESGGALDFRVSVDPAALGAGADLNEVYFNLVPEPTSLTIESDDSVATPYTLSMGPTRGGAGARFDWAVNLGNGSGPPGNGTLQTASFTISAADPLALADLSEPAFPNAVDTEAETVLFAAHVQSTQSALEGGSETVGGGTPAGAGVIPEPATSLLLAAGLGGLALAGRGRR